MANMSMPALSSSSFARKPADFSAAAARKAFAASRESLASGVSIFLGASAMNASLWSTTSCTNLSTVLPSFSWNVSFASSRSAAVLESMLTKVIQLSSRASSSAMRSAGAGTSILCKEA